MKKLFYVSAFLIFVCVNSAFSQTTENATDQYADVKKTLEKVWETDQGSRQKITSMIQKGETNTPEFKELALAMRKADEENLKTVTDILDKYGWLGNDEVGFQNSQALFLVIQHADLPVQEKYLPIIKKAAAEGKTLPSNLALLEDRILMRQGKKQIYGSQIWVDSKTGNKYLYPLEDPDNVDARRKQVQLNSISEYLLNSFQIKWDVEEYKRNLPAIEETIKKAQEEKAKKAAEKKIE